MKKQTILPVLLLVAALALAGCTPRSTRSDSPAAGSASPASAPEESTESVNPAASSDDLSEQNAVEEEPGYIELLVQQTIAEFAEPGMGEFERAKAAFDYMIANTALLDPVGLDLWRIRGSGEAPPSYLENRSLSVLLFHLGKCEDYAAAFTLLLRGMDIEAEYVPGLTYSSQGELVDHAWTIARIDGVWYHLDCQLEQNISRHGSIRYKYFMRGDATMRESHRWGQNLIDSRLLTPEQNEEIARDYLMQPCPQDYPTPERQAFASADAPDVAAIEAAIQAERAEYERMHGQLEPLELNTTPPVFALEGYGPHD